MFQVDKQPNDNRMIMPNHNTDSEPALLQQLHSGNEEALAALMKLFYEPLYDYACKFTPDKQLVKDCIQEVFISLWQRRDSATAISSPKYYLLRAVRNKVIKAITRKAKTITSGSFDDYDFKVEFSPEHVMIERQISAQNAARLKAILSQLSARQKEIIYLKFYRHLEQEQIAALMNINRQSVYNLLHESLQNLRKFWYQELFLSTSFGCFVSLLF
jgi:RNA polymerase sigma factor (sigma-70 family)